MARSDTKCPCNESGTKWGKLRRERRGVRRPAEKLGYQRRKSSASWSLRTRVRTWGSRWGTGRGPAHLLLFDHALADDLVDRGLGERGGDGLASPAGRRP